MEKSVISRAILGILIIAIVGCSGNKPENQPSSAVGNDAKTEEFLGSCTDHMYLNGEMQLYDCIEYWGAALKEQAGCNPGNEYWKAEWSATKRCSTDNALGGCKIISEKITGSYIITYNYIKRQDNTWCTEGLHGEFIPADELK